jgi:Family of unknown function (DUF6011)
MTETQTGRPATDKQATFIRTLLAEREGYTEGFAERVKNGLATGVMTTAEASKVIGWLMERPKRKAPTVPAGYYAVESATGKNDLDFFRVDVPEKGKWEGFTFVKRVIGGHPEYRVKGAEARAVLARIAAAGVEDAAVKYGQEIGRCYRCNLTLTDELSRSLGIGPVCRKGGTATDA